MDSTKNTSNDNPDKEGSISEGESLEFSAPSQVVKPTITDSSADVPVSSSDSTAVDTASAIVPGKPVVPHKDKKGKIWERVNIYMLLFVLVIIISVTVVMVIFFKNRSSTVSPSSSIGQQKLSSDALQQLASNGVQVGDPKQVLNVQSNSVFAGTVLVKGELQVAGGLKIGGGGLNIPDVTVGGTAIINQLQTQSLAVAGNTAIQGQLTVRQNLSVNGGGAFNGPITTPQLTAAKLQISGDLQLTRHLVAGGGIPGRANGGALGSGGTSSISGSDTAGSISINTGTGASAGCLVTVTFNQAFNTTPRISLTPVGAGGAGLNYYVNRTASSFSVCVTNAPPSNQTFGFDYLAIE